MPLGASVVDGQILPVGYRKQANFSASQAIATLPANTTILIITVEGQAVRWRDDGQAPTITDGMLITAGGTLQYNGDPTAMRFIEVAATATLHISCYKTG